MQCCSQWRGELCTFNPKPQTLHPKLYSLNPKPPERLYTRAIVARGTPPEQPEASTLNP